MKICWEPVVYGGQVPVTCCLCGERASPQRTRGSHYLIGVVYTQHGKVFGEICYPCATSDPTVIKEQLQTQIQALRERLAELEALAQDDDIQVPSLEEEFNSYSWGSS